MTASYIAYIDEAGDEGFKFTGENTSSRWFVLSAVVIRYENDGKAVELMRQYRQRIKRKPNYTVHFRNLHHEQRIPLVDSIANLHCRSISILCHKESLNESEYLIQKHRLYFYCVRHLVERISWLCRDARKTDGDGKVKLIFSNRSGMPYTEMRDYLTRLRRQTRIGYDIRVEWAVIDPALIQPLPHNLRAGLQVVDAVASSMFVAVEKNGYGYTEDRYARMLLRTAYRHKGILGGYGVKILPVEADRALRADPQFGWMR